MHIALKSPHIYYRSLYNIKIKCGHTNFSSFYKFHVKALCCYFLIHKTFIDKQTITQYLHSIKQNLGTEVPYHIKLCVSCCKFSNAPHIGKQGFYSTSASISSLLRRRIPKGGVKQLDKMALMSLEPLLSLIKAHTWGTKEDATNAIHCHSSTACVHMRSNPS